MHIPTITQIFQCISSIKGQDHYPIEMFYNGKPAYQLLLTQTKLKSLMSISTLCSHVATHQLLRSTHGHSTHIRYTKWCCNIWTSAWLAYISRFQQSQWNRHKPKTIEELSITPTSNCLPPIYCESVQQWNLERLAYSLCSTYLQIWWQIISL